MKIKVVDEQQKTYDFDIDKTDNLFMLKSKLAPLMGGAGVNSLKLFFNGEELQDFNNFVQCKIEENSVIQVKGGSKPPTAQVPRASPNPFASFGRGQQIGGQAGGMNMGMNPQAAALAGQQADQLRQHYAANPFELDMLLERDPELAQAILSDDRQTTVDFLMHRVGFEWSKDMQNKQAKLNQMREEMALDSDPFNVEAQREIEKRIHDQRMADN